VPRRRRARGRRHQPARGLGLLAAALGRPGPAHPRRPPAGHARTRHRLRRSRSGRPGLGHRVLPADPFRSALPARPPYRRRLPGTVSAPGRAARAPGRGAAGGTAGAGPGTPGPAGRARGDPLSGQGKPLRPPCSTGSAPAAAGLHNGRGHPGEDTPMPHALVQPHYHADTGTWSYLVADPERRRAAIIDPVLDFDASAGRTGTTAAQALLDAAVEGGWQVDWLLETHAHADHLSAAHWLKQRLPGARVAIGQGIGQVLETFHPLFNLGEGVPVDGSQFDHLFAGDEAFAVGGLPARAIPVPGHTSDSVAYLIGEAL